MFCTHCGSRIPEAASFYVGCGVHVVSAPAPSEAYVPPSAPPQETPAEEPSAQTFDAEPTPVETIEAPAPPRSRAIATCSWCGAVSDGSQNSCPKCGASLDVPDDRDDAGWIEVPGRKDMTKIQLGNSSCQIEGTFVPVADMNLAAGDSIYFTHHVLLWKEPRVAVTTMPMAGAWKRVFAGLPLVMAQATGPGHIAFSKDDPGELMPVPLEAGEAIDVREHLFLVATSSIAYDWFPTNIWLQTQQNNETETHYPIGMFMDRFQAPRDPGLVLLHAAGNVFVRTLAPGETILIKPTALVFKDPTVEMHLHFERPGTTFFGWGSWANRYLWLRMIGPGRVAIQSVFERVEGESRNLSSCSYATEQRW